MKSEALNSKHETGNGSDLPAGRQGFVLKISDLSGKVVRVEKHIPTRHSGPDPESSQLTIERGDLKPGIYFVELNAGKYKLEGWL